MKKTRLESTNFLTNVVTLVFIAIGAQGIDLAIDPGQAVAEVLAKNWEYIGNVLFPALSGLLFRVIRKIQDGSWDWKLIVKSMNFWTQVVTILAGVLMGVGIILPADAPTALSQAIFSGSVVTIIVAIIANILTPVWLFLQPLIFPPKTDPPAPVKPRS